MKSELENRGFTIKEENGTWNVFQRDEAPILRTWVDRTEAEAIRQGWSNVFEDVY